MMMDDNDDLENEEMDGLQSYARKGMAQEMAKKLGLLADVPGTDTDQPDSEEAAPDTDQALQDGKDGSGDGIDIEELLRILQKAQ